MNSESSSSVLDELLRDLDPLMIATGLACASLIPGPGGQAGAVAAIAFDVKHKQWLGGALSAASMIPLIGYLPAFMKVAWLFFLLNRRLKRLEGMLPELHCSPVTIAALRTAFGKYHRSLPKMKITNALRYRLERIMALDGAVQTATAEDSESIATSTPNSADNP